MSIIIKGLNMPKASNEDCIAVIRSNGKVEVWQTGMREFEAQAIQIPTPHGRLIDGDVFLKAFDGAKKLGTEAIKYYIDNAPTILEEEK